MGQNEVQED